MFSLVWLTRTNINFGFNLGEILMWLRFYLVEVLFWLKLWFGWGFDLIEVLIWTRFWFVSGFDLFQVWFSSDLDLVQALIWFKFWFGSGLDFCQIQIWVRFWFVSGFDLGQVWIWARFGIGSSLDLGQVWIWVRYRFCQVWIGVTGLKTQRNLCLKFHVSVTDARNSPLQQSVVILRHRLLGMYSLKYYSVDWCSEIQYIVNIVTGSLKNFI